MSPSSSTPNVNGNFTNGKAHQFEGTKDFLHPSSALEYLSTYSSRDGLSVEDLMDSKKNGGLTYNDFLMLPGMHNYGYLTVNFT